MLCSLLRNIGQLTKDVSFLVILRYFEIGKEYKLGMANPPTAKIEMIYADIDKKVNVTTSDHY